MNASAPIAATKPTEIPARGWRDVVVRTWRESGEDNIDLIAAGVAFYGFLAFVPLLAAVVLVYGLVADPASVVEHFRALTEIMPVDVARLIAEQLIAITSTASSRTGFGLIIALAVSIYGAMRGSSAVIVALNIAYDAPETRSMVRQYLMAATITLGALAAVVIAIIAISFMGFVQRLLPFAGPVVHTALKLLFAAILAGSVSMLVAVVYRYAPNRPKARWRWLTPGSVLATFVWLIGTLAFGAYVANFGNYNATYGSLGAVVAFLTWMYLSAYILLLGAELNSELERQTTCDTEAPQRHAS